MNYDLYSSYLFIIKLNKKSKIKAKYLEQQRYKNTKNIVRNIIENIEITIRKIIIIEMQKIQKVKSEIQKVGNIGNIEISQILDKYVLMADKYLDRFATLPMKYAEQSQENIF